MASGIAVVDFSVAANPESSTLSFVGDNEGKAALRSVVHSFAEEFVPRISLKEYPRIMALMTRFSGLTQSPGGLNHAQQWAFVANSYLHPRYVPIAELVAKRLAAYTTATNRIETGL